MFVIRERLYVHPLYSFNLILIDYDALDAITLYFSLKFAEVS